MLLCERGLYLLHHAASPVCSVLFSGDGALLYGCSCVGSTYGDIPGMTVVGER